MENLDILSSKVIDKFKKDNSLHVLNLSEGELSFLIKKYIQEYHCMPESIWMLKNFASAEEMIASLNNFPRLDELKSAYIHCTGDKKKICKFLLDISENQIKCDLNKLYIIIAICSHYLQEELSLTNGEIDLLCLTANNEYFFDLIDSDITPFLASLSFEQLSSGFFIGAPINEFKTYVLPRIYKKIFISEAVKDSAMEILSKIFNLVRNNVTYRLLDKYRNRTISW